MGVCESRIERRFFSFTTRPLYDLIGGALLAQPGLLVAGDLHSGDEEVDSPNTDVKGRLAFSASLRTTFILVKTQMLLQQRSEPLSVTGWILRQRQPLDNGGLLARLGSAEVQVAWRLVFG